MPPIHYLPHELSPMLKVLDDRVVEVTAMGTNRPSYSHPEIGQPDIQVALMKTEKDAVLRMAAGFTQKIPSRRAAARRRKGNAPAPAHNRVPGRSVGFSLGGGTF